MNHLHWSIISATLLLPLIAAPPPTTAQTTPNDPVTNVVELRCGSHGFVNVSQAQMYFPATIQAVYEKVKSVGYGVANTGTGPDAAYGLAQCFDYLTKVQCDLCFSKLRSVGPRCLPITTGRVYLDGCFVRVENYTFYAEALGPKDRAWCGNTTTGGPSFGAAVKQAVSDAVSAAGANVGHEGNGRVVDRRGRSSSAYAMATCWRTLNASGCGECLSNASAAAAGCLPWTEGRVANTGCFLRYSDTDFLNNGTSTTRSSSGHKTVKVVAVGCSVAAVGLGVIIGIIIYKRNRAIQDRRKGLTKVSKMIISVLKKSSLNFKYSMLEKATNSFDEANKLGEGGFGTVYKGVLADGREVAVKRLFFNNRSRAMDFFNEVRLISSVEHKNLVRLLGCSCLGPESLLVYEYLPNKSLDRFIFDEEIGNVLDWEKRFKIITGTAQGLAHLHENPKARIIHRDIKASNVLLDSKFQAKIADFGLARSFEEDKTHVSTAIAGTLGYMAPEYIAHGQLSEKADVYSFGVLVLEIISGRQNCRSITSEHSQSLLTLAWNHFQTGTAEDLIDPNIKSLQHREQMLRAVHVAFLCMQECPNLRPSMSVCLQMLLRAEEPLPAPTNPPFTDELTMEFDFEGDSERLLSETSSSAASVATMMYSAFYPR